MGAANSDAKLYDDEIQSLVKAYPDQFRVDYALSREQKNKRVCTISRRSHYNHRRKCVCN